MDKPHKLRKISKIIMKAFLREDPATPGKRHLFDNFLEHVKKETIPIIALKSGALIMFRDKNMGDKKLLQTLIEPIPPPPVTVKSIRLFFSLNGTEVGSAQHYNAPPQHPIPSTAFCNLTTASENINSSQGGTCKPIPLHWSRDRLCAEVSCSLSCPSCFTRMSFSIFVVLSPRLCSGFGHHASPRDTLPARLLRQRL
jgi:hypothetical protein